MLLNVARNFVISWSRRLIEPWLIMTPHSKKFYPLILYMTKTQKDIVCFSLKNVKFSQIIIDKKTYLKVQFWKVQTVLFWLFNRVVALKPLGGKNKENICLECFQSMKESAPDISNILIIYWRLAPHWL